MLYMYAQYLFHSMISNIRHSIHLGIGGCTKQQCIQVFKFTINSFHKLLWNLGSLSLMILAGSPWWLTTSSRKRLATVCASVSHNGTNTTIYWVDLYSSWWFHTCHLLEVQLQSWYVFIPIAFVVLIMASTIQLVSVYPLWIAGIVCTFYNIFRLLQSYMANKTVL